MLRIRELEREPRARLNCELPNFTDDTWRYPTGFCIVDSEKAQLRPNPFLGNGDHIGSSVKNAAVIRNCHFCELHHVVYPSEYKAQL
jgi:hypothetical protein